MTLFRTPPPRPFLKWVGGKRQLIPELLNAVDAAGPFRRFHEPFLGGGALFFALARTHRLNGVSYLSDVNQNLIDAYLGLRDHVEEVIDLLKTHRTRHSESYFYEVRAQAPRAIAKKAARVIYLNKTCFNGLYRENSKGKFNVPFGRYKNPTICDEENLKAVAQTLRSARIEARDFPSSGRFARTGDLVYFDPPYAPVSKTADFTAYSRDGFGRDAQESLANQCRRLADRGVLIVVSNSMTALTTDLYRHFFIYEVLANRLVNSRADRRGKVPEALITSFPMASDGWSRSEIRSVNSPNAVIPINGGIERMRAKQWLRENNYSDVADLIDEVMDQWKAQGKQTRRNWWEVLAGDSKGKSRIVAGREFPVLRVAQSRQGVPVTDNALCRNPSEEIPPVRVTGRWSKTTEAS